MDRFLCFFLGGDLLLEREERLGDLDMVGEEGERWNKGDQNKLIEAIFLLFFRGSQ